MFGTCFAYIKVDGGGVRHLGRPCRREEEMMSDVKATSKVINTSDGIDKNEWQSIKDEGKVKSGEQVVVKGQDGKSYRLDHDKMEAMFKANPNSAYSATADVEEPGSLSSDQKARAEALPKEMEQLLQKLKEAETQKDSKLVEQLKAQVAAKLKEINQLRQKGASFDAAAMKTFAKAAEKGGDSNFKAQATSTTNTGSGSGAASAGSAKAQGSGTSAGTTYLPSNWSAQTASGTGFSTDAYLQSMQVTDNVMSSWDQVNTNTNRGKQLMQLFFYFAKMAESGDMNAMYQFMKFITYIVSKDKAKQQIEMGKKLIALQDLSRQWTNKLMNVSSDASDPNASNELMKTMTLVKSETDAIATSQKLISQMMEEFAQVTETLTNTTKSALETAGRIGRTVSRFSG